MKNKLSDRVVLKLWGKRVIADDRQVDEQIDIEDYMAEFEQRTGKHAIWRGNVTKQFLTWKEEFES